MAYLITLDEGLSTMRYKVMYDVRTLDGNRKRKSKTFTSKTSMKEIEKFKRQMEYEYDQGIGVMSDGDRKTLAEFCEEYFSVFTSNLSPLTVRGYKIACYSENGILNYFNPDMKLSKITMVQMQNYLNHLAKKGKSKKTIRNARGVISVLFTKAYKIGYIRNNPAKELTIPFAAKIKEEEKFMDIETAKLALEYASEMGGNYETLEYLTILSGLRKGELSGLRFQYIYLDDGKSEIHVVENRIANNDCVITKSPKTLAGKRVIQIPSILSDLLRKKKREYGLKKLAGGKDFQDEGYVFCDDSGKPLHPDTIYRYHYRFMKRFQEKYPGTEYVKLHGLRHSYASIAIETGMSAKSLMSQLGHSDIKMTLGLYAHAFESAKKEGAERINEVFQKKDMA